MFHTGIIKSPPCLNLCPTSHSLPRAFKFSLVLVKMAEFKCSVRVVVEDFVSIKSTNFTFSVYASRCDPQSEVPQRFKLEGSRCSVWRPSSTGGDFKFDFETTLLAVAFGLEDLNATIVRHSFYLSLPGYTFPDWDADHPSLSLPCSELDSEWRRGSLLPDLDSSTSSIFYTKVYTRLPYRCDVTPLSTAAVGGVGAAMWKDSLFHHHCAAMRLPTGPTEDSVDISSLPVSICCCHCRRGLVGSAGLPKSGSALRCVRRLPSGVFDLVSLFYFAVCCCAVMWCGALLHSNSTVST